MKDKKPNSQFTFGHEFADWMIPFAVFLFAQNGLSGIGFANIMLLLTSISFFWFLGLVIGPLIAVDYYRRLSSGTSSEDERRPGFHSVLPVLSMLIFFAGIVLAQVITPGDILTVVLALVIGALVGTTNSVFPDFRYYDAYADSRPDKRLLNGTLTINLLNGRKPKPGIVWAGFVCVLAMFSLFLNVYILIVCCLLPLVMFGTGVFILYLVQFLVFVACWLSLFNPTIFALAQTMREIITEGSQKVQLNYASG